MSTDITTGYRIVLDVLGAANPGFHAIHISHVHGLKAQAERSDLVWFGGRAVSYLHGGAEQFERVTRIADEALVTGSASLTIVSNPGMRSDELSVALYRVQGGRCVTAEEYDRERFGDYPECLAAAERHRQQREADARRLYAPRTLRTTSTA